VKTLIVGSDDSGIFEVAIPLGRRYGVLGRAIMVSVKGRRDLTSNR